MKVALVIQQFPSPEHPYIFEWVNGLLNQGVDLTIITEKVGLINTSDFWQSRQEISAHVIKFIQISSKDLLYFVVCLIKSLAHPGKIVRLIRVLHQSGCKFLTVVRKCVEYLPILTCEFDVVHFNAPQIAIRRFELSHYFGAKSLVSFRGQDFSFNQDRFTPLLEQADHLHFISHHLLNLARKSGYIGEKHSVIPPIVNNAFYYPDKRKKGNLNHIDLFTAARLEWMKGYEFALQAVSLLLDRGYDIDYYIAGDGSMMDAIIYTMNQLKIQDHVHLLGWQSPESIRSWMQKSDLYLLASVDEAFNNSVLQAQSCGLPVVCSDEGGLPENIEDGITGYLFHKRDAWDMAEKIEDLVTDQKKMIDFGKAARLRASNRFSFDINIGKFLELYQTIGNEIN